MEARKVNWVKWDKMFLGRYSCCLEVRIVQNFKLSLLSELF